MCQMGYDTGHQLCPISYITYIVLVQVNSPISAVMLGRVSQKRSRRIWILEERQEARMNGIPENQPSSWKPKDVEDRGGGYDCRLCLDRDSNSRSSYNRFSRMLILNCRFLSKLILLLKSDSDLAIWRFLKTHCSSLWFPICVTCSSKIRDWFKVSSIYV